MLSAAVYHPKTPYLFKKILIYLSAIVLLTDTIYKNFYSITLQTRQNCVLYKNVPRIVFMIYENFVELFLIVVIGIFTAELFSKYFLRIKRYTPDNIFSAFLIASIIPACSCSVIPMIKAMQGKMRISVMLTFVFAAPLLNPYIIAISLGVLGIRYTLLRIISSFFLATLTGLFIEIFLSASKIGKMEYNHCAGATSCSSLKFDVYESAFVTIKKITPYIILSGVVSILYEYYFTRQFLSSIDLADGLTGLIFAIAAGIPIYLCGGADVLFLKPLVAVSHLPLGTAVAFSLTSTAICISSIIMLTGYIGKRTTAAALLFIIFLTFVIGYSINSIQGHFI